MIQVAVCGIGRTGSEVIRAILQNERFSLAAAFCRPGSEKAGKDIGTLLHTIPIGIVAQDISQAEQAFAETEIDVVIDFSNPTCAKPLLRACKKHRVPVVFCTTGYTEADLIWMSDFVVHNNLGVVYAPNVTLGVNVLLAALKLVARALPEFDYLITETHHNQKKDIPSGTAKKIASAIQKELPRDAAVPIHSVRIGGYVGVHTVLLASDCERLSLTHESFNRSAFASGALTAAAFILGKTGWYDMEDVLGIAERLENAANVV
ncbi:MAG: 4-hydroxy-tetrahydrodipicolinate reductase [Eubacteriales bacterium]|nr:4-hydroxy-tetrahydrodipicolinate reductase [Eubacteriales bacterium]